jgi:hypothetical protein
MAAWDPVVIPLTFDLDCSATDDPIRDLKTAPERSQRVQQLSNILLSQYINCYLLIGPQTLFQEPISHDPPHFKNHSIGNA